MAKDDDADQAADELMAYLASLSPLENYRFRRAASIREVRNCHKLVRVHGLPVEHLKQVQVSMVKLRHWFRTGVEPGGD